MLRLKIAFSLKLIPSKSEVKMVYGQSSYIAAIIPVRKEISGLRD